MNAYQHEFKSRTTMAKVLQPKVGGGAWLVRGKWQNNIYISSIQRWKATGRGKSFSVKSKVRTSKTMYILYIYIRIWPKYIISPTQTSVKQGDWLSFSATFWGPWKLVWSRYDLTNRMLEHEEALHKHIGFTSTIPNENMQETGSKGYCLEQV